MSTIFWRCLDQPGLEWCRLEPPRLFGTAVVSIDGTPCRVEYGIRCDEQWRTLLCSVNGDAGDRNVQLVIARDEYGRWSMNGIPDPRLDGCLDVDLGFSPSTNTLPIRRLNLAAGEAADVTAAWLRFPAFTLEPLPQRYTRIGANTYRYESNGGRFTADLDVDGEGLVRRYGTYWEAL